MGSSLLHRAEGSFSSPLSLLLSSCPEAGYIPGSGRSLEQEMTTHSSILAWRIPWVEEPGGRQYMGLQSRTQRSDQARPRGRCTSVQSAGCPFLLHHMVQGDWEGDGPPRFSISHPCPGACPPQKGQQMQAGPDVPWGPGQDPEWGQRDAG